MTRYETCGGCKRRLQDGKDLAWTIGIGLFVCAVCVKEQVGKIPDNKRVKEADLTAIVEKGKEENVAQNFILYRGENNREG